MTFTQYYKKSIKKYLSIIFTVTIVSIQHVFSQTPAFHFVQDYKCVPTVVTFYNDSPVQSNISYKWNFGKGADIYPDKPFDPYYISYTEAGSYTIKLTLIDNGVEKSTVSKTLTFYNEPVAGIKVDTNQGCVPLTIHFSDASTKGNGNLTNFSWSFGDNGTGIGSSVSHTYTVAAAGNQVSYTVTDANGCQSSSSEIIRVFDIPKPNFGASDRFACNPPLYVEFTNFSRGSGSLDCSWDFGNNETSNEYGPSTMYNASGTFNVSLLVTDKNNCSSSLTKPGYIHIGSTAGEIVAITRTDSVIKPNSVLCPDTIRFTSTLPQQLDYTWIVSYKGLTRTFRNTSLIKLWMPDSGRIDVKLKFGETGICPDSITKTFYIDYVKADFTMSDEYSCKLPERIQLTNKSIGAETYTWLLADGATNNSENIAVIAPYQNRYGQVYSHGLISTKFQAGLVATSPYGCNDTIYKYFNVSPPVARLVPDTASGCAPLTVVFSDSSRSNEKITNWKYYIDSHIYNFTSQQSVQYTFNTPGEHTAFLIISNDSGCVDTSYMVKIKLGNQVPADFSINPSTFCFGDTLNLSLNNSLPNEDVSVVFSSPGIFNSGEIYGEKASVYLRPDTIGQFPVKAEIDYNGCISSAEIDDAITISGPVGSFHYTFSCTDPLTYRFYSDVTGADLLQWTIGDSVYTDKDSFNFTFPEPGDYIVQLNASNSTTGCSLQKQQIIHVRQVLAKLEVPSVGCLPNFIPFNSSRSIDYIDSCYNEGFKWSFGDSTPDRRTYLTSYTHRYSKTGTYKVTLEVTAENGCTSYDSTSIEIVFPKPEFTIDPAIGCGPNMAVNFKYTNHDSTIFNYNWYFGDNTTEINSHNINTTHTYNNPNSSNFYPILSVKDIYGCSNYKKDTVKMIVINSDFQANRRGICKGETVYFGIAESNIDSFKIDFGDGYQSTSFFDHQYNTAGKFTVSFTLWKNGCQRVNTKTNYITVEDAAVSIALTTNDTLDCYPALAGFKITSLTGNLKTGIWNFGDGSRGNYSTEVQHSYNSPGTFTCTFNLLTQYNCSVEVSQKITITGPEAEYWFFPNSICSGNNVSFHLDNISNTDSYVWHFDDGETSTEANPIHQYFARGVLYPTLWLTKGECTVPVSQNALTVSLVKADFAFENSSEKICANEPLNALNNSEYYSSSVWSIDGDIISNLDNLENYDYSNPGNHTMELIVTDSSSCDDTISKPFTIKALPDFDITGDDHICEGNSASLSIAGFNNSWAVVWGPEEIITSTSTSSVQATPDTNTVVSATVTNSDGCSSTGFILINVKNKYSISRIPLGDTSIYLGENIQLSVTTDDETVSYSWIPANNINCTNCPNPIVNPTDSTTYIVTTTDGCSIITARFLIDVIVDFYLEFPTAFSPNGDGQNDIFKYEEDKIAEVDFRIFNRWGNLVFSSNSIDEGWDGMQNGKLQNIDTYTYFIKAKTIHGYEFEKKGTFLLIR
jgi:gliding motility-associated-like protein